MESSITNYLFSRAQAAAQNRELNCLRNAVKDDRDIKRNFLLNLKKKLMREKTLMAFFAYYLSIRSPDRSHRLRQNKSSFDI